ncbi:MAG: SpoIIE family protein phosphatase, partial [Chloroflexi bacterium]|nr:SpoIIE family protein phosphatase [Chloroflexota bacterium]
MSTSRFTVEAWSISDAGEIGGENEDTILVFQPENPEQARFSGSLYIIADGDGGGEQGRLASSYAARRVAADYFDSSEIDLGYRLKAAIQQANRDLYEYAQTRPELVKLTTTIVAAAVRGEQLSVASVGDSRAYLVRDGRATQITRDHTLVQQLLDEGAITPEEAAHHPRRDVVLRTLGAEEEVAVDVHDMRLRADDALVLTSDGLTSRLSMEEIERVVATSSPRNAADSLIQRAKLKGGKHNTSVVTALMREGAPPVNTNIPHRWDGSPPTFTAPPTLPGTPGQGLDVPDDFTSETQGFDPDVTAPNPVPTRPDDWSVPSQPPPQESQRAQPAPPYEQQVEPAPQRTQPAQPLSPQQTQPMQPTPRQPEQQPPGAGYQPPPGYQPMEVDPATG